MIFVPPPVFRAIHTHGAQQLVDELATGRAELLAAQDEFRSPVQRLGAPIRSWTQVSCWLSPRFSDGDGEQDVVMFYWQQCALMAYEIYPVPAESSGASEVAEILGGHISGNAPSCSAILFDVLSPDYGASRADEYGPALWWSDPRGEPPADQPDRCTLPDPDGRNAAHVVRDLDGSAAAGPYVVYQVRSPTGSVDVGCERRLPWIFSCAAEPDGFPVF